VIVVFSHAHPSVSKGGAEVSAYTLYLGLRALGQPAAFVAMCPENQAARVRLETEHEHIIVYRPENYDHFFHFAEPGIATAALEILAGLQPTALLFHHFLFLGIDTIRRVTDAYPGLPSALVLHEFLAICHHHGQMVTRPAKRFCSKPGLTECNTCFPEYSPEEFGIRANFFRTTINKLSHAVSPSHFLAERFAKWGVDATKLAMIENGLAGYSPTAHGETPIKPPEPTSKRKSAGPAVKITAPVSLAPVVFGYFGQINPFKGIDQIMDAVVLLDPSALKSRRIVVRVHGNVVGVSAEFEARFKKMTAPGSVMQYTGPYNQGDCISRSAFPVLDNQRRQNEQNKNQSEPKEQRGRRIGCDAGLRRSARSAQASGQIPVPAGGVVADGLVRRGSGRRGLGGRDRVGSLQARLAASLSAV
jgi:glycosyltransferase involved in cell wall biosynthesis